MADPTNDDTPSDLDRVEALIEDAREVADRDRHHMRAEPGKGEVTLTDAPGDDDAKAMAAGSP